MAETVPPKRERQPISVPFIWEEKPGMPKKDWMPTAPPTTPAPRAVKLVVSVPFGWEEKPGTPLHSFVQPSTELVVYSSPPKYPNEGDDGSSDTYSIETHDSFTSAKSLLAITSAAPCLALTNTNDHESPGSPASETEEGTSSYATGTTSLVGAAFLEWLFPLLVQPNKVGVGYLQERYPSQRADELRTEFMHESDSSQATRPLLTLGELIVMSRRRSCQRNVMKMHNRKSMDFMKRNAFGCCFSGISNGINGLHIKWKRQLQLKLM